MPEGHSVHRLARQFGDVFVGERLAVSSPQGRFTQGAALLDGHTLTGSVAHGKHLFLEFEHGLILHVHLGLYGASDFGGDDHFRGASSIGAPRKVGERELSANDDGGPAAYEGPPAPVGAVRVRLRRRHPRLGRPPRRHHLRGHHGGRGGRRAGAARPGPAAEPSRRPGRLAAEIRPGERRSLPC